MKHTGGWSHHFYIEASEPSPLRYIDDSPYRVGYMNAQNVQDSIGKQANVEFIQKLLSESSSNVRERDIKYVRTLEKIEKEKNCFCRSRAFETAHYCTSTFGNLEFEEIIVICRVTLMPCFCRAT